MYQFVKKKEKTEDESSRIGVDKLYRSYRCVDLAADSSSGAIERRKIQAS